MSLVDTLVTLLNALLAVTAAIYARAAAAASSSARLAADSARRYRDAAAVHEGNAWRGASATAERAGRVPVLAPDVTPPWLRMGGQRPATILHKTPGVERTQQ